MPRPPTPFPRAIAVFNGQAVRWTDLLSVTWEPNVAYAADGLTLLLKNLTSEGLLLSDAIRKKQMVDLYLGYVQDPDSWSQNELGHVFGGKVDGVLPHFGEGMTLEVRARDRSGPMLDQQVGAELNAESFDHMSASDFAAFFANKYGLGSQITATMATADRQNFENQSEWALLVTLAMREGFICSVDKDGVLYFGPRRTNQPILSTWSYYTAPADLLSFDPDDSALAINRVTVLRYAGPTQDFSGSWPTEEDLQTDPAILAAGGQVIDYTTYSVTAQSSADCQDQAQKLYTTMNRRRISAMARMEGDPTLIGDVLIHVGGLVGRMENDYYVERAVHTLDVNTGYVTQVDLTNIQPTASEVYRDPLYQPVSQQEQQNAAAALSSDPSTPGPSGIFPVVRNAREDLPIAWTNQGTHYVPGHPEAGAADIFAPIGSPIYAPVAGTITLADTNDPLGGNNCILKGVDGFWYYFAHGNIPFLGVGSQVQGGQQIGQVGQTGAGGGPPNQSDNSAPTGGWAPHVHFAKSDSNNFGVLAGKGNIKFGSEYWIVGGKPAGTGAGLTWPLHAQDIRGTFAKAPAYVQTAIRQAGWLQSQWDNAAAISYDETGGTWNPKAGPSPTNDWGLFQINRDAHPTNPATGKPWTDAELYDANTNAAAAYQIWANSVTTSGHDKGWCPWTTARVYLGLC